MIITALDGIPIAVLNQERSGLSSTNATKTAQSVLNAKQVVHYTGSGQILTVTRFPSIAVLSSILDSV